MAFSEMKAFFSIDLREQLLTCFCGLCDVIATCCHAGTYGIKQLRTDLRVFVFLCMCVLVCVLFVVLCCVVVFLWWHLSGGVCVVVVWWCICLVVFVWWWCGGVFVFVWWCFFFFFCGVVGVKKNIWYKSSPYTCSYPQSHQTFPLFNCL